MPKIEQITTGTIQPGDLLRYRDGTEKPAELTIGCEIENYSAFLRFGEKRLTINICRVYL